MSVRIFILWLTIAMVLAFSVITLGAYTRLTDAGLGCPDWPGCYGQWIAPHSSVDVAQAQEKYPMEQIDSGKAWTEMIHRYFAGSLGLLIFIFAGISFVERRRGKTWPVKVPLLLVVLVVWQALLGMWTVTLQLHPLIVMAHLLGGLAILGGLTWWRAQLVQVSTVGRATGKASFASRWIGLGLLLLIGQIALGGWVSANYAGMACIGFPTCNGQWWPAWRWEAFHFFTPLGVSYEGGLLSNAQRISIQMAHRMGALLVVGYWSFLIIYLWIQPIYHRLRILLMGIILLFMVQFVIGMINVLALLPLTAAIAHNAVAALLLISAIHLYLQVRFTSNP